MTPPSLFAGARLMELSDPVFDKAGIRVRVLRCDETDVLTGGNKWFKLRLNLEAAGRHPSRTILTFGGAFSNHVAATAAAVNKYNGEHSAEEAIRCIGVIRGEEESKDNITLSRARNHGMELHFVSRGEYRLYRNADNWKILTERFGEAIIIPEGGANDEGVVGARDIAVLIPAETSHVLLPVGTGSTMAGLIAGLEGKARVVGIAVVKASDSLDSQVEHFVKRAGMDNVITKEKYTLLHQYTFGGYAKKNKLLEAFVQRFNAIQPFEIEPLYSGRMFYALYDLASKDFFQRGSEVVAIHTGGLQYLRS